MDIKNLIRSFKPHVTPVTLTEKLRGALGASIAILLLGLAVRILPQFGYPPLMLASMSAAALLLFATPHSPMAQPWPLIGGNLLAALLGLIFSFSGLDFPLAAGCAIALSIFFMHMLKCLHPPGAATLIWVLDSAQSHHLGWMDALYIVAINSAIMLLLALLINNLVPGRQYPAAVAHTPAHPQRKEAITLERADIEWAASHMDGVIDVSVEDLEEIYELAAQHARGRGKERGT
jgi:CBS domain-containing membrane protein